MIPRYQRILFALLLGSSLLMGGYLIYLHGATAKVKNADNTPLEAPVYSAAEEVMLAVANDAEGTVTTAPRSLALPAQPAVRARALLDHLLAEYARPNATHAVGGGIAVDDVYLVPLPIAGPAPALPKPLHGTGIVSLATAASERAAAQAVTITGELAIVNLRSAWVDVHPSGITSETLTIQSILATLHLNLPEITEVRFLVDGKPRPTLAGNVILDRTFDMADVPAPESHR